jgi:hypothetical protein
MAHDILALCKQYDVPTEGAEILVNHLLNILNELLKMYGIARILKEEGVAHHRFIHELQAMTLQHLTEFLRLRH